MEPTTVIAETFEVARRRELREKVVQLDDAMRANRAAIGELGICRTTSYAQAQQKLDALTAERGRLLGEWNRTLSELAQL